MKHLNIIYEIDTVNESSTESAPLILMAMATLRHLILGFCLWTIWPSGLRDFLAPELISQKTRERSKATDAWSCAVVVHMLVRAGEHPFNSANLDLDRATRIVQGIWPDSGRHPKYPPPGRSPRFDSIPKTIQRLRTGSSAK